MTVNPLGPAVDPTSVLAALDELTAPYPALLDSALVDGQLGRWTIIVADPFELIERGVNEGDGFRELAERWSIHRSTTPAGTDTPPFMSGALGYVGYECGRWAENLPASVTDPSGLPDLFMGFYGASLAIDHQSGRTYLSVDGRLPGAREASALLREAYSQAHAPEGTVPQMVLRPNFTESEYCRAVARVREYILAGDIYQANLTQRFEGLSNADPLSVYAALRSGNPAPFGAYIDLGGEKTILSSSPERFFEIRGEVIRTRPIKGTRPRGKTEEEDRIFAAALQASEKDRAELLMIVDLERNDLSRVCVPGTVVVPELFALETYATVHHLVATVEGRLLPEAVDNPAAIWRALFPGGSITGAPKIRAMEIIDELESVARKVYTGAIGYMSFDGDWDFNIAIRTVVRERDRYWYQVGGGVVWDSDPLDEHRETLAKGAALARALNGTLEFPE